MSRSARIDAAMAAAGLLLLGVSWVVAATLDVSSVEEWVFRFFNDRPDWLEGVLWPIMQLGTLLAVGVGAVAVAVVHRDWWPGLLAAVSGLSAWTLAKVVKEIVARARPQEFFPDGNFRPLWEGFGYVSGHAAVAFALVAVLGAFIARGWRVALWAGAVTTALARVYTGAHLPLDVIGGAGLGLLLGGALRIIEHSGIRSRWIRGAGRRSPPA